MIVKVDHISFSCPMNYDYRNKIPFGYKIQFMEKGLKNLSCKRPLMHDWQDTHDIFFLVNKDAIPIEIAQYKTCVNFGTNLEIQEDKTLLYVKDIKRAQELFKCMGFVTKKEDPGGAIEMQVHPILDKSPFCIKILPSEYEYMTLLDSIGYSSIGLFTDNAHREIDKMEKYGYEVTGMDELMVNGKWLDIGFIRGYNGEILEFISLKRG